MSFEASASSSWLCLRKASSSCFSSLNRYPSFFSFVSCCTDNNQAYSSSSVSTRSYGRPWYNPLSSRRRHQLDRGPDITRLWVEADDQTLASPGVCVCVCVCVFFFGNVGEEIRVWSVRIFLCFRKFGNFFLRIAKHDFTSMECD